MKNKYCIYQKSHSIVSPIAIGSQANFDAFRAGESRLQAYQGRWGIPEPFFASIFQDENSFNKLTERSHETSLFHTRLEKIAIKAAELAIAEAGIDASSDKVLFVLSTTKGNVELLENTDNQHHKEEQTYLWYSAQVIANHFGNHNTPIVVSNACISGCAAQIAAFNMLQYSERYDYVVVIGAEVLSKFIIAGFQSFKALSPERCKPFDQNRCGLNLGEAAAAIVYARTESPEELPDQTVLLEAGAINNDANHISGPSRTGEGLLRSIRKVTENFDFQRIAFINAHGTATLYNDDMESVAINRAGLQNIPVNSLKGYYGHTLGAAGVMEVILSSIALQKGIVLKTLGTETPGTAQALQVSMDNGHVHGDAFMKLISGFGGSNAALLFSLKQGKQGTGYRVQGTDNKRQGSGSWELVAEHHLPHAPCNLTPNIDEHLSQLYRNIGMNYPKFFKMDRLCKAGILGAEQLLKDYNFDQDTVKDDWGIILMNSASSLDNDRRFQETIAKDNYYPSPAVFVYTLANIVTGEIAIRHKIGGESSFYVMPEFDKKMMEEIISQAFTANPELTHIICGWVDVDQGNCDVKMFLCRKNIIRLNA
ncbi:MAG: 3-oxoacyl-ACP synthase [Bacteroidales bacterium]|nr:3-oxoacyl-ACP synthase [Bacteroidales bacterium]